MVEVTFAGVEVDRCTSCQGASLLIGCTSFPSRSTAIDLPEGSAERGKVAFQQLQCYVCHPVSGYVVVFQNPPPNLQPWWCWAQKTTHRRVAS